MDDIELKQFLETLHHHLNILQEREAKFGGNAPLDLINQIEDHQTAIALVEARLNNEISKAELERQLAPLTLGLDRGDMEIVAGKNIVKIGNITVPALPLVIGVMVALGIAAFATWYFLVPSQMPLNTFNVAVADFGQVDAQGRVSVSEDGKNLSEWMFGEMQAEYKNWPANQPVAWHDSMSFLQKRGKIGMVQGDTPAERQQVAQKIAERIGAQMVIYGNIAVDENPPYFIPEFYIADLENEADEIVGTHQLGSPIEVRLPLDLRDQRAGNFFQENLGVRADALVWFTRGLALDLSGRHEDALTVFNEAGNSPELESWDEAQGRRILDYFIGREALFLTRDPDATLNETKANHLDQAEAAFKKALGNDENYPRAYIGLGGVYFQRAQSFPPPERLENDYLNLAIEQYSQAVAAESGTGSQVETKGVLGLGKTYRLLGEAHLFAGNYDQALPVYEQAITSLEKGIGLLNPTQHRDLAEAYHALGAAYHGQGHIQLVEKNKTASETLFEKAFTAYDNCIKEADAEFYDTTLQALKSKFCEPKRENVLDVLAAEF
ncbi:MAG: tetratricopeptide repeat protein [Anaerolineae bacterium]|nr:tetratricopeptide repeat protein [Anaerolineae bacterium]